MPTDGPQLIVRFNGQVVQTLPLSSPVLKIGRLPDNDLPLLGDPTVGRQHAEVRLTSDGAILIDLESRNGTFVDGIRLSPNQPHRLADGHVVRIGAFTLTYRAVGRTVQDDGAAPAADEESPRASSPALPAPVVALQSLPPAPPSAPRATYPLAPLAREVSSYVRHLTVVFEDNDFLQRYLLIFESIWEPLEQRQDHIAMYVDPRTCPAAFLPWLASWLHFSVPIQWPEARMRHVLTEAMELYRWRGTRYGLERLIEVCTGLRPRITEDAATPFMFRVSLAAPEGSEVDRDLVEALIQAHKPAHAGYVLEWME